MKFRSISRKRNKKGSVADLILFGVLAFIVIFFFGIWLYVNSNMNSAFASVHDTSTMNFSSAINQTWTPVYNAFYNHSDLLGMSIIVGMILLIFFTNFLVKVHPAFIIIYILFMIFAIFFSIYISNAYTTISNIPTLSASFQHLTASNWFMSNLPLMVAIIGVVGGIILFAGIIKDDQLGGGIS